MLTSTNGGFDAAYFVKFRVSLENINIVTVLNSSNLTLCTSTGNAPRISSSTKLGLGHISASPWSSPSSWYWRLEQWYRLCPPSGILHKGCIVFWQSDHNDGGDSGCWFTRGRQEGFGTTGQVSTENILHNNVVNLSKPRPTELRDMSGTNARKFDHRHYDSVALLVGDTYPGQRCTAKAFTTGSSVPRE